MSASSRASATPGRVVRLHPAMLRATHWTYAASVLLLIGSGWEIHDESGLFAFLHIPTWMTLSGRNGLVDALLWHFFAMWLLVASLVPYLVWGVASGHFRRRILPLRPLQAAGDIGDFLRGRLRHRLDRRNAVQRLLYAGADATMLLMVLTGFAIWKPVQLSPLARLFGGYTAARTLHFLGMAALVGFVAIHLLLVALVPRSLPPMLTGRARLQEEP